MAEALLSTETSISIVGINISILTEYVSEGYPYILKGEIKDDVGNEGGEAYIEGELLIKMKDNYCPSSIDAYIDNDGNLILVGDTDVNNYYLDIDGNLMWSS